MFTTLLNCFFLLAFTILSVFMLALPGETYPKFCIVAYTLLSVVTLGFSIVLEISRRAGLTDPNIPEIQRKQCAICMAVSILMGYAGTVFLFASLTCVYRFIF